MFVLWKTTILHLRTDMPHTQARCCLAVLVDCFFLSKQQLLPFCQQVTSVTPCSHMSPRHSPAGSLPGCSDALCLLWGWCSNSERVCRDRLSAQDRVPQPDLSEQDEGPKPDLQEKNGGPGPDRSRQDRNLKPDLSEQDRGPDPDLLEQDLSEKRSVLIV